MEEDLGIVSLMFHGGLGCGNVRVEDLGFEDSNSRIHIDLVASTRVLFPCTCEETWLRFENPRNKIMVVWRDCVIQACF
jgi:hypothetical protein